MDQPLEVGYAGARVQKMATHHIWVAMPSGFVASMYIWDTREEEIGLLATLAYFHYVLGKFRVQTTLFRRRG